MVAEPLRLVGEEAERGRVRLREAEAGEADELVVDKVGHLLLDTVPDGTLDEARPVGLERGEAALAAHRTPQPFRLPHREPGERDRDVEHLVLEDDDTERRAERLAQRLVVDRVDERGVLAQQAPVLDVGVHRLPLDRPRPHERDLHREVVDVLGLRAQEALHLRPALDLEGADRVGPLDLGEHVRVVERDPGEVDRSAVDLRDLLHAVLDGGEHPEPEQVDLEKAGVRARVLVPLAELAARHRRGLHGDEVDQRARRDHHPAGVLGDVPRQAGDLGREELEGAPPPRDQLALGVRQLRDLLGDPSASQPSVSRASRSSSACGRPSALPTSRMAPRDL